LQLKYFEIESFIDLLFPEKPELWREVLGARGGIKEWLSTNKRGPRAAWLTAEVCPLRTLRESALIQGFIQDAAATRASLTTGGLAAPLNWYKLFVEGINKDDDATLAGKKIEPPLLYIGATGDAVCPIPVHKQYAYELGTKVSDVEFDTGHWVMLEQVRSRSISRHESLKQDGLYSPSALMQSSRSLWIPFLHSQENKVWPHCTHCQSAKLQIQSSCESEATQ